MNALEDAVFYGNEGRIRPQTLDRQSTQVAALALVSAAIVTRNTHHVNEIVERERVAGRILGDVDVARLSPAIHAHINLDGRYHIRPDRPPRRLVPGATGCDLQVEIEGRTSTDRTPASLLRCWADPHHSARSAPGQPESGDAGSVGSDVHSVWRTRW